MAIACELCGGKLVMRSGGIAVCDVCGLEYSLERMRELLAMSKPEIITPPATGAQECACEQNEEVFFSENTETGPAPSNCPAEQESDGFFFMWEDESAEANKKEETDTDSHMIDPVKPTETEQSDSGSEASIDFEQATKYYDLAMTNYELENYSTSMSMCDRALSLKSDHVNAMMLKCDIIRCIATKDEPHLEQAAELYSRIFESNCSEDEQTRIKEKAVAVLGNLAELYFEGTDEEFIRWPDEKLVKIYDDISTVYSKHIADKKLLSLIMKPLTVKVTKTVSTAWDDKILLDYDVNEKRHNKIQATKLISRIDICNSVLTRIIKIHPSHKEILVPVLKLLVKINQAAIDCSFWSCKTNKVTGGTFWKEEFPLDGEQVNAYKLKVKEYGDDLALLDPPPKTLTKAELMALAKERFEKYWQEHSEERRELEEEKELIGVQISELKRGVDRLPGYKEEADLTRLINSLIKERNELNSFKNMEKTTIQQQIDESQEKLRNVRTRIYDIRVGVEKKIAELEKAMEDIDHELTRER